MLGDLEEPEFPEQLRAAEAGMREVERSGLFRLVAGETHEIGEHYDDADELIETWETGDLETSLRAVVGPVRVVSKVVFASPCALGPGETFDLNLGVPARDDLEVEDVKSFFVTCTATL